MNKRTVGFGAVAVLMVVCIIIGVLLFPKGSDNQSDVVYDTSTSEFDSYVHTEQHLDTSKMEIVVSELNDKYTALMKYFDVSGAAYFDIKLLSDEQVEKFESSMEHMELADVMVASGETYVTGVVTHVSSEGSTTYNVEPFDISGFIEKDPWSEDVDTVVSKPACAELFSKDSLESVLQPATKTELHAYIKMIYEQVVEIVGTDKLKQISIADAAEVDGFYQMTVLIEGQKDATQLLMSACGYVMETE